MVYGLTSFPCILFAILFTYSLNGCDAFDIKKDLVFRLYTREDPIMYYALNAEGGPAINDTTFNPNRPTRIFVHGFRSKVKVLNRYCESFLNIGDYNFIAVDWIEGASTLYYYAAKGRVRPVSMDSDEMFWEFRIKMVFCILINDLRFLKNSLN